MRAWSAEEGIGREGLQRVEVALFLRAARLDSAHEETSEEGDGHGGGGDAGAGQVADPGKNGEESALPTALSGLDAGPDAAVESGAVLEIRLPTLKQGGEIVFRGHDWETLADQRAEAGFFRSHPRPAV